jgi:sugar phosphate isomerase/epimerase
MRQKPLPIVMDKASAPGPLWRTMKSKQIIDQCCQKTSVVRATLGAMVGMTALLTGCAGMDGAPNKGNVGLQLWSVRSQMNKDAPGTLAEVQGWGVKYVELAGTYKMTPAQFKQQLDAHGLEAISGHFPYDRFRDDPEGVMKDAETFGMKYVGCPWIPHQGAFDEVACRQAIAVFNRAGALAAQHHMTFFYHPHGYEFEPFENGTLLDLLIRETNPDQVKFQMDIFWIAWPGQDPVQWLEKYPTRWKLMHMKDIKKGVKTGRPIGQAKDSYDVVLGTGQLDMPAILRTAEKVGVKWYVIEDESDVSEQQIPESLRYLLEAR